MDTSYGISRRKSLPRLVNVNVTGMTCAASTVCIEKGLGKVPGVSKAYVNFAFETATAEYDVLVQEP